MQALPQGQPRKTISDSEILAQLRVEWAGMSESEQIAFTEERVRAMEEDREVEALGTHTTENSSFHDVRTTIDNVENQVSLTLAYVRDCINSTLKMQDLYVRTGTEVLAFMVRPNAKAFNQPYVMESSPRIGQFFHSTLGMLPSEFVVRLEGFCVSGKDGSYRPISHCILVLTCQQIGVTHQTPANEVQDLRSACTATILQRLRTY